MDDRELKNSDLKSKCDNCKGCNGCCKHELILEIVKLFVTPKMIMAIMFSILAIFQMITGGF